jgi:hypothetical protein
MWKKSKDELRRIQELRRSNAATKIPNKKKYTRQNNKKMLELVRKGNR